MKKEEIEHLAGLARIALAEEEAESIASDVTQILAYVSEIDAITADTAADKKVGVVYNVMREDGEPDEAGVYTETLLGAAPKRKGQYIEVKKILDNT